MCAVVSGTHMCAVVSGTHMCAVVSEYTHVCCSQ